MPSRLFVIVILHGLWMFSCTTQHDSKVRQGQPSSASSLGGVHEATSPRIPSELGRIEGDYPHLHNLLRVTDKIYSGGTPGSEQAFASLVRLGVRTIVSVDGATPDAQAARRHGLRYVHIPIGYDGIDREAGLSLARVVQEVSGPIYVHCHHGRHRAPSAAAIASIAAGKCDGRGALKILELAGTSKDYAGLWRSVSRYQPPPPGLELPDLVETAEVHSFSAAMAKIDHAYDNLKLCRDAQWSTPKDHPDLVPVHEALLLKEGLHESARNLAEGFNAEFKSWLTQAESIAQALEASLKSNAPSDDITPKFNALAASCKECHIKYRD